MTFQSSRPSLSQKPTQVYQARWRSVTFLIDPIKTFGYTRTRKRDQGRSDQLDQRARPSAPALHRTRRDGASGDFPVAPSGPIRCSYRQERIRPRPARVQTGVDLRDRSLEHIHSSHHIETSGALPEECLPFYVRILISFAPVRVPARRPWACPLLWLTARPLLPGCTIRCCTCRQARRSAEQTRIVGGWRIGGWDGSGWERRRRVGRKGELKVSSISVTLYRPGRYRPDEDLPERSV